jgi:hypothetical protein
VELHQKYDMQPHFIFLDLKSCFSVALAVSQAFKKSGDYYGSTARQPAPRASKILFKKPTYSSTYLEKAPTFL